MRAIFRHRAARQPTCFQDRFFLGGSSGPQPRSCLPRSNVRHCTTLLFFHVCVCVRESACVIVALVSLRGRGRATTALLVSLVMRYRMPVGVASRTQSLASPLFLHLSIIRGHLAKLFGPNSTQLNASSSNFGPKWSNVGRVLHGLPASLSLCAFGDVRPTSRILRKGLACVEFNRANEASSC